jgi:hypothetical protein
MNKPSWVVTAPVEVNKRDMHGRTKSLGNPMLEHALFFQDIHPEFPVITLPSMAAKWNFSMVSLKAFSRRNFKCKPEPLIDGSNSE